MIVALKAVSDVPAHEGAESCNESALASIFGEVESFEVVDEDEVFGIEDALDLAALVEASDGGKEFLSGVRDYLPSFAPAVPPDCLVVIALDLELEASLALHHLTVGQLVLIQVFQVVDVLSELAEGETANHVDDVAEHDEDDRPWHSKETVDSSNTNGDASVEDD